MLTTDERKRYDRQIMIRGLGEDGQEKLKQAAEYEIHRACGQEGPEL